MEGEAGVAMGRVIRADHFRPWPLTPAEMLFQEAEEEAPVDLRADFLALAKASC